MNRRFFVISDTHFNHKEMLDYCERPIDFEMRLFKNLKQLQSTDILIHLGDVGMRQDEFVHNKYIKPLTCKKWLTAGNHDHKSNNWYLDHGWDFVCKKFYITLFGKRILFSHIPEADDGYYDLNIHGHFHNSNVRSQEPALVAIKNNKHRLIAVENSKYRPILVKTIVEQGDTVYKLL